MRRYIPRPDERMQPPSLICIDTDMVERNPKYDGLHVFKLDLSRLNSGDVLLTRNAETASSRDKLQSDVVAKATGGNFNHALLCTKPPTFVEAIRHGVSNISVQNCFAHDLKNVRLLRYHDSATASEAGSVALPFVGRRYSVHAALRSILPNVQMSVVPEHELFCSALVAAAFRKAGAAEFAALDPMKVTPATLEKATYFKDVTSDAFVRILSPSNIEELNALDGDGGVSPYAGQAKLFQSYCDVLLPLIGKFIDETPIPPYTIKPTSFLECMVFIAAVQRECDKLPDAVAESARSKIVSIDDVAYALLSDGRYEEMQRAAAAIDENTSQDVIAQSFAANPDIDLNEMRGLIIATRQQISSRSKGLGDSNLRGYSRVFDKWLRFSEEVVGALTQRLRALEEVFARVFPSTDLNLDASVETVGSYGRDLPSKST
jgi:hypothetical protein